MPNGNHQAECDCIYCRKRNQMVHDAAVAQEIFGDDELEYFSEEENNE